MALAGEVFLVVLHVDALIEGRLGVAAGKVIVCDAWVSLVSHEFY